MDRRAKIKQQKKTMDKRKVAAKKKAQDPLMLVAQAEEALMFGDCDSALAMLQDAHSIAPDSPPVLCAYGSLLAELGRAAEARAVLLRAAQVEPDSGFEKFMYLGQLLEGGQALDAYQAGVRILEREHEAATSESSPDAPLLSAQLCSALCALAEHLVAGSGDGVAAVAGEAEGLLRRAAGLDPESPEPLQALASLKYETGHQEEALSLLRASLSKWFHKPGSGSGDQDMEAEGAGGAGEAAGMKEGQVEDGSDDEYETESEEDEEEEDGAGLPSYEFRFEAAKMLVELDERTDDAVKILEGLLVENTLDPHVWHLLGLANYGGGKFEEAKDCLNRGEELMTRMGVPKSEPVWSDYADLGGAIADAFTKLGITQEEEPEEPAAKGPSGKKKKGKKGGH